MAGQHFPIRTSAIVVDCEGQSDDCSLTATETRDTSDGNLPLSRFCHACAVAYDKYIDNYDGPGDAYYEQ